MIDSAYRHRFIARALLAYCVAMIVLMTVSPFRFDWPGYWKLTVFGDVDDTPVNFILFLPVGYFFRLAGPRHAPRGALHALLFGAALSFTVEGLQLLLPARLTAVFDFISNSLGAGAGAVLCDAIRRRLDRELPAALALEHPLVNLAYLLLPLMWFAGTGIDHTPARAWLLAPLGVIGVIAIVGLWRHRFAPAAHVTPAGLALLVFGWFAFGAVSGLRAAPEIVAPCAAGAFALAFALARRGPRTHLPERRSEPRVLAAIWPWYVAYLVLLVLLPFGREFVPFASTLGYPQYSFNRNYAIRMSEQIAALTLLGYLVSQSRGRARRGGRRSIAINVAAGAACALGLEVLHGFLPDDRASGARWLLGTLGAGFGVMIYTMQLSLLRLLRGESVPSASAPGQATPGVYR
ncbi:MAG: VanZ family protein [Gammaproteobacteria bacterium]